MLTPIAEWLNTYCASFDQMITIWIHGLYNLAPWFFTPFMNFISLLGKGGIFLIILSLALVIYKPTRRYGTGMILGLAIGALLVNCFLKVVVARPRPYLDENSVFYQFWKMVGMHTESDKSFPSGHTNAAFGAMIPLWLTLRKNYKKIVAWTPWIFGILMGISRIYLCVHYPTDVIGGMVTGILSGIVGYIIASKLPEVWYGWQIPVKKKTEKTE